MKGALIVGINDYPGAARLRGCVNDATALAQLLETNGDGTPNFSVILQEDVKTRAELRKSIIKFFNAQLDTALFYFSGHGCINERGGFIVTPDFRSYDEGISMDELLAIVNNSPIKGKIIIIDCCHAGALGVPVIIGNDMTLLGNGVTLLTATMSHESAIEVGGHGVFTSLLLDALAGGAADIMGNISPASVYSYIDRSLSFWEQRPQLKTSVSRFASLRSVNPLIPGTVLRNITKYFTGTDAHYKLDPTYEFTNTDVAIPEHVVILKELQKMYSVGLVVPVSEEFMYFEAQNSGACKLTHLGKYYWKLVKKGKI